MNNFELMRILQQINLSNRNKKFALYFGVAAFVAISAAVYWHRKNNAVREENNKLSEISLSLMQERDSFANSIRQLNQKITNQEIVIKKYAEKSFSPEKID